MKNIEKYNKNVKILLIFQNKVHNMQLHYIFYS
jgi:hypothetical protein